MIQLQDGTIVLNTKNTSYVMGYTPGGLLQNLHYGSKIRLDNPVPLQDKTVAGFGGDVLEPGNTVAASSLCLELSPVNRGDYRRSALLASMPNGAGTTAFGYTAAVQRGKSPAPAGGMPHAHGADAVLEVSFSEPGGLAVELFYSIFYDCDVITKKMRITNRSSGSLMLQRALSQQLDLLFCDYTLYTLNGAWARESQLHKRPLAPGIVQFGSTTGISSHRSNPFFFLAQNQATEFAGDVYGFNLVHSGSHEASVEVDTHGKLRVMQGVASEGFAWPLAPGEAFTTPEAVLTFSANGKDGMSQNMHRFVRGHILPPQWANAPRPVLVNNWEGTYFSFDEGKLLGMAKIAAKLGIELFVLDDGWFGQRNSDKAGLGDYDVNRKKLSSGLDGLAKKINALGMDFGLWFEPEMVNEDSELFRAHPDWVVQTPGYAPCTGRNQYVLDLCRPEVRGYIIQSVNEILSSANIKYVKWDMNRNLSDCYSPALESQGMFAHSYALGLYQLFDEICLAHPDILFEGCSSGGNRFDLGILSYMPQIWTSDDSDAIERQRIQTGISYGYPQCCMGCHVSAVPNHQSLRKTPLGTRFNTAVFGQLGYELDLRHLTAPEQQEVAAQVRFYKQHRILLQYGRFMRLANPFEQDNCRWMVVAEDGGEAMLGDFITLLVPNSMPAPLRMRGLCPDKRYTVGMRPESMDIRRFGGLINYVMPMHVNPDGFLVKIASKVYRLNDKPQQYTAYGSLLCNAGLRLRQAFSGTGYNQDTVLAEDFASRLYYIQEAEETAKDSTP